jgi:hypothetical protein
MSRENNNIISLGKNKNIIRLGKYKVRLGKIDIRKRRKE